jgi:hypothetical protein
MPLGADAAVAVERQRQWRGRGSGEAEAVERQRQWRGRGRQIQNEEVLRQRQLGFRFLFYTMYS